MVVLSTSVCTKNGKVLVSRQFMSIPRSRIEGLLAAFPKLLSGNENQQHTFIETTSVRYLYQRFEDLFLIVITNKSSNIIEDLETLHVLSKVIPDYCGSNLNEKAVVDNAFELIFAFDEVISMGYKESVTLDQIRTFIELDSSEEKIHEMIEKNKEREAQEEVKRRIKEMERERREREKMGLPPNNPGSISSAMGRTPSYGPSGASRPEEPYISKPTPSYTKSEPQRVRRGMQLGKKPTAQGLLEQIHQEGETGALDSSASTGRGPEPAAPVSRDPVEISLSEQLVCALNSDGSLRQLQVNGEFLVTITDENFTHAHISVTHKNDIQFRIHPNINRDLFAEKSVLAIITNRAYPVDSPTGVLKWRYQTNNEREVPLVITVWPNIGNDGKINVTVEYEVCPAFELFDVVVKIPVVGKGAPRVSSEEGSHKFDSKNNILEWHLPLVNRDNSRGAIEFSIDQWDNTGNTSWLFPVLVNFSSRVTFTSLRVTGVTQLNGEPILFSERRELQVHEYTVG